MPHNVSGSAGSWKLVGHDDDEDRRERERGERQRMRTHSADDHSSNTAAIMVVGYAPVGRHGYCSLKF